MNINLTGRIDANNAAEVEAKVAQQLAESQSEAPVFDASGLEYISSAGLRVLLKFRKQFGHSLDVVNVSSTVYDIFEVTGFTELFNVKKKMREVSIEGCPVIGGGYFSTVYRIDPETIIKVFNKAPVDLAKIEADQKIAREVFLHDIPTAISYDVVRVGEHYGIVYEMIDADTLSEISTKHPERFDELVKKAARLLRRLHNTTMNPGSLPDGLDNWRDRADGFLAGGYITQAERSALDAFFDTIPDRHTFIHADYHAKNLLVQNDEIVLIDVGDSVLGHPIIDIAGIYMLNVLINPLVTGQPNNGSLIMGVTNEIALKFWETLSAEYFGTSDKDTLQKYEEVISVYAMFRLMVGIAMHDEFSDEMKHQVMDKFKGRFFGAIDSLKPLNEIWRD